MSEIFTEQLTAAANLVLAVFAIVTAVLAGLAFREQSREVGDQAEMLELQRRQLEAQRDDSAKQAGRGTLLDWLEDGVLKRGIGKMRGCVGRHVRVSPVPRSKSEVVRTVAGSTWSQDFLDEVPASAASLSWVRCLRQPFSGWSRSVGGCGALFVFT